MRFLYVFFCLFVSFTARAEIQTNQVGTCSNGGTSFGLYLQEGQSLQEGTQLSIVSSEVSPVTGLNLTLSGVYHASTKIVSLPHWTPSQISFADCRFAKNLFSADGDGYINTMAYLQFYFIEGAEMPDEVTIDQLIKDGKAIPFKAHIICRHHEQDTTITAVSCNQIRFLDEIIPVDHHNLMSGKINLLASTTSSVAIESRVCGTTDVSKGSGVVISFNGKVYVLTSSNVIQSQHGSNSCTDIVSSDKKLALRLIRHDYATGLALLESDQDLGAPIKITALANGDFPDHASIDGKAAEVLATESTRQFIPKIKTAIEVLTESEVTSDVVGKPLVSDSGELLGIVAHQHLKIYPGSLTRPTVWASADKSNQLIAISATDILRWLSSAPETVANFQPTDNKLKSFQSGQLLFTEDCPTFDTSATSDQYPIGGGDAIGIGGDASGYRACKVIVRLAESSSTKFFVDSLQGWHDSLVSTLKVGDTAEVLFQFSRDVNVNREFFYSAESFFQILNSFTANKSLATVIQKKDAALPGVDSSLNSLRSLAKDEAEMVRKDYMGQQFTDFFVSDLFRKMYMISVLSESEQWRSLQKNDFDQLLDPNGKYKKAWELVEFIVIDGKKIKAQLQTLEDEWLKAQ